MKPGGSLKNGGPVILIGRQLRHRGALPVIDHLRRTLVDPLFEKKQSEAALRGAYDVTCIHPQTPELCHHRFGEGVPRQSGDKSRPASQPGE